MSTCIFPIRVLTVTFSYFVIVLYQQQSVSIIYIGSTLRENTTSIWIICMNVMLIESKVMITRRLFV